MHCLWFEKHRFNCRKQAQLPPDFDFVGPSETSLALGLRGRNLIKMLTTVIVTVLRGIYARIFRNLVGEIIVLYRLYFTELCNISAKSLL